MQNKIKLSRIFAREKPLLHFFIWDESDRQGIRRFLGTEIRTNLFIVPPSGTKGSVWYSEKETQELEKLTNYKLNSEFIEKLTTNLKNTWDVVGPYLKGEQKITSTEDLSTYYSETVKFWESFNSIFYSIPDNLDLSIELRNPLLEFRKKTEQYTEKVASTFLDFVGKRKPELSKYLHVLSPQESLDALDNKLSSDQIENIEARLNGCFLFNTNVYNISELDKVLSSAGIELEQIDTENIVDIKGSTAYKGLVKGVVKLVRGFDDLKKITDGDILVTEMTNPEYLSAIKRAGAIITDEGGVLSHAAIVAREMKIPCIIGTKIATQVLKDGMMVEVDADNGVIKILDN